MLFFKKELLPSYLRCQRLRNPLALELPRQDAPLLALTLAAADAANVVFKPPGTGEAPQVGTDGVLGSYGAVASRTGVFAAGVDLFMLRSQPSEAGSCGALPPSCVRVWHEYFGSGRIARLPTP